MKRVFGMATALAGIAGIIVTPVVAILAMITIVGAPLGVGLLLFAWPRLPACSASGR